MNARDELRRSVRPIAAGVAVLWLIPVSLVAVVASHEHATAPGRVWSSAWFLVYAVSLSAWWLPAGWFRPRPWEVHGRLYAALGVRWHKQFMLGGERFNRRVRRHTILGAFTGWWKYAVFVTAGNVLVNVYPILLQRDTRARIVGIDRRRAAHQT